MKTISLIVAAVAACSLPAQDDAAAVWFADYDKAVAEAKQTGKDLLVDFTGSDWCGWCIKLDEEVFEHDVFLTPAQEKFVLVKLDFPRSEEVKAKVPNPERNQELQAKFGVRGFPTILLLTNDGAVFGRTGYQRGGPEAYVEHLEEMITSGKTLLADIAALEKLLAKAPADGKLPIVTDSLDRMAGLSSESPGIDKLAKIAEMALTLDANNEKGIKERAVKALLATGQVSDTVRETAIAMDPKNEIGLREQLVAQQMNEVASKEAVEAALVAMTELAALGFVDQEIGVMVCANGAYWSQNVVSDTAAAAKFAKLGIELGADGRMKKMLTDILEQQDDEPKPAEGEAGGGGGV